MDTVSSPSPAAGQLAAVSAAAAATAATTATSAATAAAACLGKQKEREKLPPVWRSAQFVITTEDYNTSLVQGHINCLRPS